ncbi:hypothetical protein ACIQWZ_37320 [Streptomyces sp. NPDC098077]|uniref:hypothetical protein n=1 Tax=Streptomyces sp. NPDC098077 TaxID=3366093 RepID=UPI00382401F1
MPTYSECDEVLATSRRSKWNPPYSLMGDLVPGANRARSIRTPSGQWFRKSTRIHVGHREGLYALEAPAAHAQNGAYGALSGKNLDAPAYVPKELGRRIWQGKAWPTD